MAKGVARHRKTEFAGVNRPSHHEIKTIGNRECHTGTDIAPKGVANRHRGDKEKGVGAFYYEVEATARMG